MWKETRYREGKLRVLKLQQEMIIPVKFSADVTVMNVKMVSIRFRSYYGLQTFL
jgi:hypothetical protein